MGPMLGGKKKRLTVKTKFKAPALLRATAAARAWPKLSRSFSSTIGKGTPHYPSPQPATVNEPRHSCGPQPPPCSYSHCDLPRAATAAQAELADM